MSTLFSVRSISGADRPRPVSHVRMMERGDITPGCQWVFNHHPHAGEYLWDWDNPERVVRFHPNLSSTQRWAYVIYFHDGTRGVCRVVDINPALRALGYEIGAWVSRGPI